MIFKIISLVIIAVCVVVALAIPIFFPEHKYKGNTMQRIKILVRIRAGCFLLMLVLLLICLFI